MVSVTISAAGKPPAIARGLPYTVEIPGKTLQTTTVGDVKKALAVKYPAFYPSRQKLSAQGDKKALDDEITLATIGIADGGALVVKDLGPQISWRTVFMVEYVGPLIIHPLIYHFPKIFYGKAVEHSMLQNYVYAFVMLHFAKRELETVFVHRFSHGTMPAMFIFRNSAHYHLLSGVMLAYAVYSPTYSATSTYIVGTIRSNPIFLQACGAIWAFFELSNLHTHLTLRALRPAGTRKRAIPFGYGFNSVSCPNYFFEIMGWLVVSLMTGSYAAWIFLVAGSYMMVIWAIKKHKNYKKEFGTAYPRNRKIIFPYIF